MHNNHYLLIHLVSELNTRLAGLVLTDCFSQQKDELIFSFSNKPFFIKATLLPEFCCLSFPQQISRRNKNSIDLFQSLIGQKVICTKVFENERAFEISFTQNKRLIFKMHGNRSNVILFNQGAFVSMFKKNLKKDLEMLPNKLDRLIEQTKDNWERKEFNTKAIFPTFDKYMLSHIEQNFGLDSQNKWKEIQKLLTELNQNKHYLLLGDKPKLYTFNPGTYDHEFNNAIDAINTFFLHRIKKFNLWKASHQIISSLEKNFGQSTRYLINANQKLAKLTKQPPYNQLADIIMANLHNITPGANNVELFNFYTNESINIKLKTTLTPQRNAELYYKKGKNFNIELDNIKASIKSKETQLENIKLHVQKIRSFSSARDINQYLKDHALIRQKENTEAPVPYNKHTYLGYDILIGKNAKHNDTLTLHIAKKNDLWLHAKDVAGSHVIIKDKPGKNTPKPVIEKAASLAAFNSKRKNETVCPVIVVPKKFVRKKKGSPSGAVIVEKETVIMVSPAPF